MANIEDYTPPPHESDEELNATPNSQEAEQALIGALLYDNEIFHRVSGIVKAKHFYNPIHVRIFD